MKRHISILFLILITIIIIISIDLEYGQPKSKEFSQYYLKQGLNDTGAMNLVAAVYLDYRVYDTLIETVILFMAVAGITFFLKREK